MPNANDLIAQARQARRTATETQAAPLAAHEAQQEVVAQADVSTDVIFDIEHNEIARIAENAEQSIETRLKNIAELLSAGETSEGLDFATAQQRFATFEAYLAALQGRVTAVNKGAIQKLIDDLQKSQKSQVEKIVGKVIEVQTGSDRIRDLLKVFRESRIRGKTIDDISAAMKLNDQLKQQIESLDRQIAQLAALKPVQQASVTREETREAESKSGFGGWLARKVNGPDAEIASALRQARSTLATTIDNIERTQKELDAQKGQYDSQLETGDLRILRTIEVTEKSFSQEVIANAERSLALITGIETSVSLLLADTLNDRSNSDHINDELAKNTGSQTVLRGALQIVADATHTQNIGVKAKLDAVQLEIAGLGETDPQKYVKEAERDMLSAQYSDGLKYETAVKSKVATLQLIGQDNETAGGLAAQFSDLVAAQYSLLNDLHAQALPALSRGLFQGLSIAKAMRTAELAASVRAVTQRAQQTGEHNAEDLAEARKGLETEEVRRINAVIQALESAKTVTEQRTQAAIDHGLLMEEKMGVAEGAAKQLHEAVVAFSEVHATLAGLGGKPGETPADGTDGDGPTRAPGAGPVPKPAASAPSVM